MSTHRTRVELKGCNLYATERTVSEENMDVVLTEVEPLDAVLADPIILLTWTEERYGWDLE